MLQCIFEKRDEANPQDNTCAVCGFKVVSRLPVEKIHAECGKNSNTGRALNISAAQPDKPVLLLRHIRFGDLAELLMRIAAFGTGEKKRQAAWVHFRNAVFCNWVVSEVLGVRVRKSKTCDCAKRRDRWNSYGAVVVPIWLRWALPPRWYVRAPAERHVTPSPPPQPTCEACTPPGQVK